jgi:hypothetical protein
MNTGNSYHQRINIMNYLMILFGSKIGKTRKVLIFPG